MIYQKKFHLAVCNGPSKNDLSAALMTGCGKHPFRVRLELEAGQELPNKAISAAGYRYLTRITGLQYEDGSGDRFNFMGTLYDDHNGQLKVASAYDFTGFYDARKRRGYVEFMANYVDDRPTP